MKVFQKVSFHPYNFRITGFSARQIYRGNTKIRLTLPSLSSLELYSRWVLLILRLHSQSFFFLVFEQNLCSTIAASHLSFSQMKGHNLRIRDIQFYIAV